MYFSQYEASTIQCLQSNQFVFVGHKKGNDSYLPAITSMLLLVTQQSLRISTTFDRNAELTINNKVC